MGAIMVGEKRFVADTMLGTLAKWLRILGYDTAFCPQIDDSDLVRQSRAEERILLTRDTGLRERKGLHVLFIAGDALEEQLAQVLRAFDLRTDKPFSRCPVCNTELEDVPKGDAWGQVPPFVFQTQDEFKLCPDCNRFYWRGSHWRNMLSKVEKLP